MCDFFKICLWQLLNVKHSVLQDGKNVISDLCGVSVLNQISLLSLIEQLTEELRRSHSEIIEKLQQFELKEELRKLNIKHDKANVVLNRVQAEVEKIKRVTTLEFDETVARLNETENQLLMTKTSLDETKSGLNQCEVLVGETELKVTQREITVNETKAELNQCETLVFETELKVTQSEITVN